MNKFIKLVISNLLIFTIVLGTNFFVANAAEKSILQEITPRVTQYCIYGAKHRPVSTRFAKVKIDGDSTFYNFSRATCACGNEIFYDGYPSAGYVGRYFQNYYDTYNDFFLNMTIFKVHSYDVHSNYSSGNLIDWQLAN